MSWPLIPVSAALPDIWPLLASYRHEASEGPPLFIIYIIFFFEKKFNLVFLWLLQPHEVSPEYLKGKAAKTAVAVSDKNKSTSKEVKRKLPAIALGDSSKVSR